MPEEIYAGHGMLLIQYLFSNDMVKVWLLEPIPYPALFCVYIENKCGSTSKKWLRTSSLNLLSK